MRFRIASVLSQYTQGERYVEFDTDNLEDALNKLNHRFPGIKFRFIDEQNKIRPHMNIFKNNEQLTTLDIKLKSDDEIFVVQSLSGG